MTDLRQAAKLALDWFKCYEEKSMSRNNAESLAQEAIAALKRALANDAMDKMAENARELGLDYGCPNCASLMEQNTELDKKLAEWVGLTEDERRELRKRNQQHDALMLATEKLLKEKNT